MRACSEGLITYVVCSFSQSPLIKPLGKPPKDPHARDKTKHTGIAKEPTKKRSAPTSLTEAAIKRLSVDNRPCLTFFSSVPFFLFLTVTVPLAKDSKF